MAPSLREWGWNTGSQGAIGDVFTIYEYDGYLVLEDAANAATVTVPWHIVPRQANDISASATEVALDEGSGGSRPDQRWCWTGLHRQLLAAGREPG